MSAFIICEPEDLTEEQILKTLELLGYTVVEKGTNLHLYGYRGDKRKEVCEIVVRRKHIGSSSNDLGFKKVNGKFQMVVSEYDQRHLVTKHKGKQSMTFQQLFTQAASTSKVLENAKKKKMKVSMPPEGLRWGEPIKLSMRR
jgi:hypothetical protein